MFLVTNCSYYGMPSNYIVTSYVVFKASNIPVFKSHTCTCLKWCSNQCIVLTMHSASIILALQCVTYNSTDSLAKLLSLLSPISFCYFIYNPLLLPVYLQKTKRRLLEYRKKTLLPKHIIICINHTHTLIHLL